MSFTSWLRNVRSALAPSRMDRRHRRQRALRAATHRPYCELLEDRCLLSFSPAVSYPVGQNPQTVLTADFNGDGQLDLATVNRGSSIENSGISTVSVLLGNADGTFQPALDSATGYGPLSLAVGDFNGDGKLDLVTANDFDLSVLRGNGDGTFQAPTNIDIGSDLQYPQYPNSVAVGDFNGDGKLDLGVTSNVYYSGTPGYWVHHSQYYDPNPAPPGSTSIWEPQDYDVYYPGTPGYYEGRANVLLGNGDGSFSAANTTWLSSGWHQSAAVADFNGDGKQDFATLNYDYGTVSVLLGDSSGYLQGPTEFTTGWYPQAVTVGDFTGDGILDLATAGQTVDVLPGYGDGTFQPVVRQYVDPVALAAADFNSDGKLDLVTVDYSNSVSVLLGTGAGTFRPPINVAVGAGAAAVAVGDFNGDGRVDAASANSSSNNVSVLLNDGIWPALDAPSITIGDVTVTEGNTGTVNATFTLTLSRASDQAITVHYETADGSATAGSDYAGSSGDVTFAAGETSQTITIMVFGDRLAEPTESFAVNISTADAFVGDGLGYCEILDDEPSVSINDVTVTEGNTGTVNAIFTVSLSAVSDGAVTVQYDSADQTALAGSDYQAAGGTVTFAAGETTRTITVLVNGDMLGELDEAFLVNLSSLNAHVTDGQGMGTILGDDPVFVWLNPWQAGDFWSSSGDGGSGWAEFGAIGSAGDLGPASATANAFAEAWGSTDPFAAGWSYFAGDVNVQRTFQLRGSPTGWNVNLDALLSGSLFARSEYSPEITSSVSAQIRIIEDTTGTVTHDLDFGQYYCTAYGGSQTLNVSAPGSREGLIPDGTYTVIGWLSTSATGYYVEASATVGQSYSSGGLSTTIDAVPWTNQPAISISDATFVEGNTGAVTGYFTVALSNPWNQTVTVDFGLADGSATLADNDYGYLDANRTLSFAPGVTQQTIAVQIYGDRKGEPDETFSVNLSNPTNATIADGQGIGTILDDEPRVSIGDASVAEGHSGTTAMNFVVTLSAAYDADVTISFATQDGSATSADNDYRTTSSVVMIPAGETRQSITVLANGDTKVEADESFSVHLTSATAVAVDGRGLGTIRNDDTVTKFYVVDASSDKTFEYDPDGLALENYNLRSGNNDPRGAASDASGERVWVIDNDDYVYVYDAAGNSLGSWKANGLSAPEGIASDGTDIWIVDRGRDRVYRYAGAADRTSGSASATSSFALNSGNGEARGIETDGTHLWVVNNDSTDKVFKYTLGGSLVGSWTLTGGVTNPTGITLDPSNPSDVWIVDASADKVFQYTAAAGRTSGSQSAAAVFNLAAGNTNPQGIADPPPAGAMAAVSGGEEAADVYQPSAAIAASTGSRAAPAVGWVARPEPPTHGVTAAQTTDETPPILHRRPVVRAAPGMWAFASGESVRTIPVEIDGEGWESGESISLRLFNACDAIFADAIGLGHILDDECL